MANNNSWIWIVLAVIAVVLVANGTINLSGIVGKTTTNTGDAGCTLTPAYVNTGIDSFVPNSNVTVTSLGYIVNGVYVGTSHTPSKGQSVQVVSNPIGYLADVETVNPVICGNNPVGFKYKQYGNATVQIYTDAGTSILSNNVAGGTVNETAMTTSKNWQVTFTEASQKSSSKIFWYVEMPSNSAANVSSVTLSCNGVAATPVASIPAAVSSTNTNAYRKAFEIDAIQNGAKVTCNLGSSLTAGTTLDGGVRTTFYAENYFVDTDGTIKLGIYDANNNAKYKDAYTYNFLIA